MADRCSLPTDELLQGFREQLEQLDDAFDEELKTGQASELIAC